MSTSLEKELQISEAIRMATNNRLVGVADKSILEVAVLRPHPPLLPLTGVHLNHINSSSSNLLRVILNIQFHINNKHHTVILNLYMVSRFMLNLCMLLTVAILNLLTLLNRVIPSPIIPNFLLTLIRAILTHSQVTLNNLIIKLLVAAMFNIANLNPNNQLFLTITITIIVDIKAAPNLALMILRCMAILVIKANDIAY